jgi:hypothetical protein
MMTFSLFLLLFVSIGASSPVDEHVVLDLSHFNAMLADSATLRDKLTQLETNVKSTLTSTTNAISIDGLPLGLTHVVRSSAVDVVVSCDQRNAIATHTLDIDVLPSADGRSRWASIDVAALDQVVVSKTVEQKSIDAPLRASLWNVGTEEHSLLVLAANATVITPIVVRFATRHAIVNAAKMHSMVVSRLTPFDSMTLTFDDQSCNSNVTLDYLQVAPLAFVPETESAVGATTSVLLASTKSANIEWRVKGDSSDTGGDKTAAAAAQMTASVESLYSVSDDGVQGFTALVLAPNADSQNLQHLTIDVIGDKIRITEVSGLWIDNWSVSESPASGTSVHVRLRRPIGSAQYTLVIRTEMATDNVFELPVINPHDCVRISGRTAVTTAKNNVEISELSAAGVAHIGERDVGSLIAEQSQRPVLLAYSFVNADSRVRLHRRVHGVLDTVPAFSEHVHETIHIARDHSMHIVRGLIQNSRRQFMTIVLPRSLVNVLSVSVNSDTVAPSLVGGSAHVMSIPLLSTLQSANDQSNAQASFEVVFTTRNNVTLTTDEGEFDIALSQVDMPTTLQTATVRLPASLVPTWLSETMSVVPRLSTLPTQVRSKPQSSYGGSFGSKARVLQNVDDELAGGHYATRIVEDHMIMRAAGAKPIELPPTDHMIEAHFERNLVQANDENRIRVVFQSRDALTRSARLLEQHWAMFASVICSLVVIVMVTFVCRRQTKSKGEKQVQVQLQQEEEHGDEDEDVDVDHE